MPIGDFVNAIPAPIFLLIHLAAFAIGAYFAWRSFNADASTLGWGFSLYALASPIEISGEADAAAVRDAVRDSVLAEATLTGVYARGG